MSGLTKNYIDTKIKARSILMFAKSNDPDSKEAKIILEKYSLSTGSMFEEITNKNY